MKAVRTEWRVIAKTKRGTVFNRVVERKTRSLDLRGLYARYPGIVHVTVYPVLRGKGRC